MIDLLIASMPESRGPLWPYPLGPLAVIVACGVGWALGTWIADATGFRLGGAPRRSRRR